MIALRPPRGPQRIVCLTEETTELLYLLGEQDRIVGITAYTVRPAEARRDKPIVSAFVGGSIQRIRALRPDLIIGFSDVQAEYARSLIAEGLPVLIFNQRSIQEILDVMLTIGSLVLQTERTRALIDSWIRGLDAAAERTAQRPCLPTVYFEEWDEPMISCIQWVDELIERAGGRTLFPEEARQPAAKGRYVSVERVRDADPEVYLASWCGKPFDRDSAHARLGDLRAFQTGRVHELPAEIVLQPGPACLTDGLALLESLLHPPC
jgi:iron complex transport system substrate-binding protein